MTEDELLADAPLLAAWLAFSRARPTSFTIPGHKGAADRLSPALGAVLATDVPLFGGLDTVKLTAGVLADAQARAARLWGGDWCRFSTGGSTHANQVVALAVAEPGATVLVSRSAHRSTLSGLVLAGLSPVWLPTTVDEQFGVPAGLDPAVLAETIAANPTARAVFVVEPSYVGTVSDLPGLVAVAHTAGLPIVVDQAWGAHFGFHPQLPPHALAAGADALVFSAHKTLPAYSQASVLVARTGRLDPHRLDRAFELSNTTSPAGSILASIDGARALLAARGPALLGELMAAVASARHRLARVPGVAVLGPDDFPERRFDPTKLVVLVAGAGVSGVEVEQDLLREGLPVELADHDTVVPMVTMADTSETLDQLVRTLTVAVERRRSTPREITVAPQWAIPTTTVHSAVHSGRSSHPDAGGGREGGSGGIPRRGMTPRDAFFARHRTVDADAAVGHVSAELVAPYPPGVPVLMPGEVVTAGALAALRAAAALGTRIAYAADPTLRTLQVIDDG